MADSSSEFVFPCRQPRQLGFPSRMLAGRRSPLRRLLPLAILWVVTLSGCGGSAIDPVSAKRLKMLSDLYCMYADAHSQSGPSDAEALKKHIRSLPGQAIMSMSLDLNKLDEMFTSPRDQQPYTVRYGMRVSDLGKNA